MDLSLVKITLMNLLVRLKKLGQVKEDFIKKLPIFIKNIVMIMTKIVKQQKSFIKMYKINCTSLSQE